MKKTLLIQQKLKYFKIRKFKFLLFLGLLIVVSFSCQKDDNIINNPQKNITNAN